MSEKTLEIDCHQYELIPVGRLGSHANSAPRKGALIRIGFSDGRVGYADCFPWPELGDQPLEAQLESIKSGRFTNLSACSVRFAEIDAEARFKGISLFQNMTIPKSHFLLTDSKLFTFEKLEEISRLRFTRVKLKVGSQPEKEAKLLRDLYPILKKQSILLRLDFNSPLSFNQVEDFFFQLGPTLEEIDFVEDPTPYDPIVWTSIQERWGIRIALDCISNLSIESLIKGSFSVLIIKPAVQNWEALAQLAQNLEVSAVVTSYLDHPVGQLFSAWVASQLKLETCGLLSHTAYETNHFSELFKGSSETLYPPEGTGIGFDRLLAHLSWKSLSTSPINRRLRR